MEAGFIVLISVVILLLGIIIGFLIAGATKKTEGTQGIIYAYYNDSDSKPSLLLEYNVPIDDITSRKQVVFDVTVVR